jgi:hypothetical protein
MKRTAVLVLLAFLACTTAQQPAPATTTNAPAQNRGFKNLQVLPKNIPREQLIATMRGFTRALGVRCDYCHAATAATAASQKPELDFPSDAKDEKRNARTMIRMTREINRTWISKVDPRVSAEQPRVLCWTCHRGKPQPEVPPAPEEPPAAPRPSR